MYFLEIFARISAFYLTKKGGDERMPGIKIRENESFDEAYRRFKKQADRNLVVTESRARRFFESQTEKRKKQKISAKKKMLKRLYVLRRYESKL